MILAHARKSHLVQNIAALYGVHAVNYLLPLVTIPFLARVLKPEGWGSVALAQSFGQFLILVIEYGFNLSATREVSTRREDPAFLARILTSVLLAKIFLSVLAVAAGLVAQSFVPALRRDVPLLWATIAWAVAQGMSLVWFFQGIERLRFVSAVDAISKSVAVVLVLCLIRRPDQGWLVLVVYASASTASTMFVLIAALRRYGFSSPRLGGAADALRIGFSLFLFRSSVSLYTVGNVFLLGLFVDETTVGIYAGAERISKGVIGLMSPISMALYPRLSALVAKSREEAAVLARKAIFHVMLWAIALAIILISAAPLIVRLLLGRSFQGSVLILRVLALLVPLIAGSNLLGIQWMLPLRCDRAFNSIIIAAGLVNLGLACLLSPMLGASGMAIAVVTAEACVTFGCALYLERRSLSPLSRTSFPQSPGIATC